MAGDGRLMAGGRTDAEVRWASLFLGTRLAMVRAGFENDREVHPWAGVQIQN